MAFARFMSSSSGRLIRVTAGLALIVAGAVMANAVGAVLAVVGVVPLAAGALDICLFAPLFRAPLRGRDVRTVH